MNGSRNKRIISLYARRHKRWCDAGINQCPNGNGGANVVVFKGTNWIMVVGMKRSSDIQHDGGNMYCVSK